MTTRREKTHTIREAGLRTERKFFGKRGIFVKAGHVGHLTRRRQKNPTGGPFDHAAARELELWATNDATLYRQMEVPIRLNLEKKYQKGLYQPALAIKLWQGWADEAAKRYTKEFSAAGDKWFEIFSPATRRHVATEQESFHRGEMELGNFQVKRKNPITLVGNPRDRHNPPKRIMASVAGVLYNRCLEIRAEKTLGRHKGLWYHPFKKESEVQILALDTGDLLIHSRNGKFLWKPDA